MTAGKLTIHPKVAGGGIAFSAAYIALRVASHWLKIQPADAAMFEGVVTGIGAWLSPWLPKPPTA